MGASGRRFLALTRLAADGDRTAARDLILGGWWPESWDADDPARQDRVIEGSRQSVERGLAGRPVAVVPHPDSATHFICPDAPTADTTHHVLSSGRCGYCKRLAGAILAEAMEVA